MINNVLINVLFIVHVIKITYLSLQYKRVNHLT